MVLIFRPVRLRFCRLFDDPHVCVAQYAQQAIAQQVAEQQAQAAAAAEHAQRAVYQQAAAAAAFAQAQATVQVTMRACSAGELRQPGGCTI